MRMIPIAIALGGATFATPAFACASCGCTLTSDWLSQGLVVQPGTTIGLRYDTIPQTDLRTQTRAVTPDEKALPAEREIEKYTYNHTITATLDRQFTSNWGINVQVPILYRPHATFSEGETDPSFSRTQGIGDVRITARWQGFKTPGRITGVQLGVVIPTGRFRQTFRSGPEQGSDVDRGLQTGTGTVQAVVGAYMYGNLTQNFDYIVQAQGQIALNARALYKPGSAAQISAGLHYTRWRSITPQLQMTFRAAAKDSGVNSDRANSGGEQLHISPGLVANLGGGLSAFAYVQLPLYQRFNGFQLSPKFMTSTGVQFRF